MVDRCVYCGKENKIYKLGYCKSCYDLMLTDKYILNPDNDFKDKNIKNMVEYFLKNPTVKKKTLDGIMNCTKDSRDCNLFSCVWLQLCFWPSFSQVSI